LQNLFPDVVAHSSEQRPADADPAGMSGRWFALGVAGAICRAVNLRAVVLQWPAAMSAGQSFWFAGVIDLAERQMTGNGGEDV
jgi:hypothetical protein